MNLESLNPRQWFKTPEQEVKKEFAIQVTAYISLFKKLTKEGHILESLQGQTRQLSAETDTRLSSTQRIIRDTFKTKIIQKLQLNERSLWDIVTEHNEPRCRQIVEEYLDKMLIADTLTFCNCFSKKEKCRALLNDPAFIDSI